MLLAVESSTPVCSVSLRTEEGRVYEKRVAVKGSHSEKLFLFLEELFHELGTGPEELETVILSEGPGSYTGLRIGAGAIKGLMFQSQGTLFTANTLAAFAMAVLKEYPEANAIHSIIDARRVHLYHQRFTVDSGMLRSEDSVEVIPIDQFEKMVRPGDAVIGTGLERISGNVLKKVELFDEDYISARLLFDLFQNDSSQAFVSPANPRDFEPKYYSPN